MKKYKQKNAFRVYWSIGSFLVAFAVLVASMNVNVPQAMATTACSSGADAQSGITVAPSHGSVFYIDTGVTPVLDAGYVGYRVTNGTGSTQSDLWTEVSSFSGGKVTLANPADTDMQLPNLTAGSTGVSYFLLKATGATTSAQTHTVSVYNHRPDLSNSSLMYQCTFTFAKVQETIKAAANKLQDNGYGSSAVIAVSDSSPELGQLVTVSVEGVTGNVGQGSLPDNDIIWFTPAAVSSWPTRALRLESMSVTFDDNNNWNGSGDEVTYTDKLLIQNANGLSNVDGAGYRAFYNFRVIGNPSLTVKAVPVAQISSGTQVKHTDTSGVGTLDITFSSLAINATLTKSVTTSTGLTPVTCTSSCVVPGGTDTMTYVPVPYRLTAASSTATTLTIDDMVDTPANGVIFKPGSATITDIGRTAVSVADPVYISSESGLSPRPYHFIGPFTFNSGTNASLDYIMWVPVGTFANTAYATLGDTTIGATSAAKSRVTVVSNGTGTVEVSVDTVSFGVAAETDPATNITTSGATLNATVDPNGAALLTGQFQYGTDPGLSGATTVTATTPASGTLGGLTDPTTVAVDVTALSPGTIYYYRVVAGSAQGSILSFSTIAVLAPPTSTTVAATSVTTTGAVLNGSINPNLTSVTGVQFIYGTSSSLASGNTTVTQDDGSGTTALTIAGSSTQVFEQAISGLSAGTTYYFKIRACTSSLTGSYPNVSCSSFRDGSILSFVASNAPTVTTNAATSIGATTATLRGTVNAGGASTATSFIYGTVSDLSSGTNTVSSATVTGSSNTGTSYSLSGLSESTTYYFRAEGTNNKGTTSGSILSFTTLGVDLLSRTFAITGSYPGYTMAVSAPTVTSAPSLGAGAISYSSSTPLVCLVDLSDGTVTFVSTGTCTIGASIDDDGTYVSVDADPISFSITLASRTHSITGSYPGYTMAATPPTITSAPSLGAGTKSYSSSTPAVCGVGASSGIVTFANAGTCTIGSSIASDGTYISADATPVSFLITLASRTHSITGSYPGYTMTSTPPTITSAPSLGTGTKTYSSSTLLVCTVGSSSGVVVFVSIGTCTIGSHVASDGTYIAADAEAVSFGIILTGRTYSITGSYPGYTMTASAPTITASPSLGAGTKTYSSSTLLVCTVGSSSGLVTFVSAGTCTIGSHIASDGTYSAVDATPISFSITLTPRTHAITGSYPGYTMAATPPTIISAPSLGAGTKSYSSSDLSVCTVGASSGIVVFAGVGTCTIGSHIASDGIYASADAESVSFEITLAPRTLTIDIGSYNSAYAKTANPPTITATASFGTGTKSYSSSTPLICTVDPSSGVVTFVRAGICTLGASILSDGIYDPADSETVSITVTHVWYTPASAPAVIFPAPTTPVVTNSPVTPSVVNTVPSSPAAPEATPAAPSAPAVCSDQLTKYIKFGANNDPQEVKKLKAFLRDYEGEKALTSDGIYDKVTFDAVVRFQEKYLQDVLTPWGGTSSGTGYVYKTTLKKINEILCTTPPSQCTLSLTKYIKFGANNDPQEVKKLKAFLRDYEGEKGLTTDGVYDRPTFNAVVRFQEKYPKEILAPWGNTFGTGYVYQTTIKKINEVMGCVLAGA